MGGAKEALFEIGHRELLRGVCREVSRKLQHDTFQAYALHAEMLTAFNEHGLWIVKATVEDARKAGDESGQL